MRAGVQMPIIVAIKKTGKPASLSVLGCIEYLIVAMKLHWHPLVPSQVRIAPHKTWYDPGRLKLGLGNQTLWA